MKNSTLLLFLLFTSIQGVHAQGWSEVGTGTNALQMNGIIPSMAIDKANNIYVAVENQTFTYLNGFKYTGPVYYYVRMWNGTNWQELGSGSTALNANSWANSVIVDSAGNVYAAGKFTNIYSDTYVAKWNGQAWSEVGGLGFNHGFFSNSEIYQIAVDKKENVYAVGAFTNSNNYNFVAKYDGYMWSELGTLNANGVIETIEIDDSGYVYVAGNFLNSNNQTYIAKWNGTSWNEVGPGNTIFDANSIVRDIVIDSTGNVYAAGLIKDANGWVYVAKWNGTTWSELGLDSNVISAWTLSMDYKGNLYAAGDFKDANGYQYVAQWNGTNWTELGTGNEALNELGTLDCIISDTSGYIYIAGNVRDTNSYGCIKKWNINEVNITTSNIPNVNTTNISIYPNPSTGVMNITDLSENVQLSVINVLGESVATQQLTKGTANADLSNLSPGMYTLIFTGQAESYTPVKWMKE